MKPERWHEVERLYHLAREQEPDEREAFLKETCLGDDSLRREVESLLACRAKAEKFIESPALEASAGMLAADQPAQPSEGQAFPIPEPRGHSHLSPLAKRGFPPWWILFLSIIIAAAAGFLFYWHFFGPETPGWTLKPIGGAGARLRYQVTGVLPQSPAERAGLQVGDVVLAKDAGRFAGSPQSTDRYSFQVERRGKSAVLILELRRKDRNYWMSHEGLRSLMPVIISALYLMLATALVVARPQDPQARWGALLLAQLGLLMLIDALPGFFPMLQSVHAIRILPMPLGPAILLGISISVMFPAGAFAFLGGFPRHAFTARRAWLLVWMPGILLTIPLDLAAIWLPVYAGTNAPSIPAQLLLPGWIVGSCYLAASPILLVRNYYRIEARSERRRLRMVALGFGVSMIALAAGMVLTIPWAPIERFRHAYWRGSNLEFGRILMLAVAPICTAYAILRHKVFDIQIIVRLGLRYAAARGLLVSIVPAAGLALVADVLTHGNQTFAEIAGRRGLLYAAIALAAFLLHTRQKTWLNALDRRFFRERYEAQRILNAVVGDIRQAATFDEAAPQVISQIEGALHPEFALFMVRRPGDASFREAPTKHACLPLVSAGSKLIGVLRLLNRPIESSQSRPGWLEQQLPIDDVDFLRQNRVEWIFPVSLGGIGTEAILLLGPKRSQEPYSREDSDLLLAITGSLALLLEKSPAPGAALTGFRECPECGTCYDSGLAFCETDRARLSTFPYSRTLANRYWFERWLGRGGMGSVLPGPRHGAGAARGGQSDQNGFGERHGGRSPVPARG